MTNPRTTFLGRLLGTKRSGSEQPTGKSCSVCGHRNPLDVPFCSGCGSEFPLVCDRFDAFISYRRDTGSDLASLLKAQLANRYHKRLFLDVNELQVGRFDEVLLRRIEEAPNFILVLSRASLDRCASKSDWLKREIMHALETGRNVIPVFAETFAFPSEEVWALLPGEMRVLSSLNGVTYSHVHQDAAVRKIASYMKTEAELPQARVNSGPEMPPSPGRIEQRPPSGAGQPIPSTEISGPTTGAPPTEVIGPSGPTAPASSIPVFVEPAQTPVIQEQALQATTREVEARREDGRASLDSERLLFATNAIYFVVGAKDSEVRSFAYLAGTAVQYSTKGKDDGSTSYQLPSVGGKDIWLRGYPATNVDGSDRRVFFTIAETGHVGYLVDIWEDCAWFYSSVEGIKIADNLLGVVEIKSDQIISLTVSQGHMSVQTRESGAFTGGLQKIANHDCGSFTMGPCLVTGDAVIALVRTNRTSPLTLKRMTDAEQPLPIIEAVYWDRSQLKFRLPARAAVGHFDERVRDRYIQFSEQSLGGMRIGIPQIKRLTLDLECKEAPVVVETFSGNVFRGVCHEQVNLSGTLISLDKVRNLVLEALERDAPFEGSSTVTTTAAH